jgi:TolB protein
MIFDRRISISSGVVMSTSYLSRLAPLLVVPALLTGGCGGGDSTGPDTELTIIAQTEGSQPDANGYSVQVGSGSPTALGANNSITVTGVPTGPQSVTLSGIAPNCAVTGDNPMTVQIQSGAHLTTSFHIVCTATPGGTYRIALMTTRDPSESLGSWEINIMNSDGSVVALTSNAFEDAYPVWSPDGQKILFSSDRDGALNLYVMNQDGSNVVRLTTTAAPALDRFADWSPDGTKIVFESNRSGGSEIYVMKADGSNVTRLTNNTTGDNTPHFSPDGSKIVFVSNRDAPDVNPPYGKWEVYVMNADGSGQTRITNDGANADLPSFLGTDKIVFDSNRAVFNNIFIIGADGSGETELTNNLATTFLPVGSPDRARIMFTVAGSTHAEVFTMNPDGSGVSALTRQQDGVSNVGYSYRR